MTRQGSGLSKLFVGVDYGTTYSGIAYALSGQTNAENVKVITAYPEGGAGGTDGSNEYIVKVPSRIAYRAENEGKRNFPADRDAWGYEVEAGFKSYSWIKLLLDSKATATDFDDPILQKEQDSVGGSIMTLPEGKTAIDVTTDYLTNLYRHCIAEINKTDIKTVLPVTPIEFWFTHPATWSDEAKAATKQAAERAGFTSRKGDTITLIPEPEAGAIAALRSSKDSILGLKARFPVNDILECMLIKQRSILAYSCVTVEADLTPYTITALEPRIMLDEQCPGEGVLHFLTRVLSSMAVLGRQSPPSNFSGGKCGATALDRNLHALLARRFRHFFTNLPIAKRGPGSRMMRDFEVAKRGFVGEAKKFYHLQIMMDGLKPEDVNEDEYDFEDHCIILSSHDLQSLYDPIVEQILGLVSQQISTAAEYGAPPIKTMILVGGFGSSLYLWNKLQAWCSSNGGIDLITTTISPWSAIARGAALRGLDGALVHKKICRRHYGTTYDREFRDGVDSESLDDTYTHDFTGRKMVRGYMDWFFHKGAEIFPGTKTEISWNHFHRPYKPKRQATMKIYYCDLNTAPEKRSRNVKLLGTVFLDFRRVNLDECPVTKKGLREEAYQIKLICVVTLGSKDGTLEFAVKWNNRILGKAVLEFDKD